MDQTLLRVRDIAELLNCRPLRVYKLIWSGELQALKLGSRTIRVRPEALDAYLASKPYPVNDDGPGAAPSRARSRSNDPSDREQA